MAEGRAQCCVLGVHSLALALGSVCPANHFWPPQAARAAAACDPHCARPSATEPSYLPTTAPPRVRAHAPPTLPAGRLDHYFTQSYGQLSLHLVREIA